MKEPVGATALVDITQLRKNFMTALTFQSAPYAICIGSTKRLFFVHEEKLAGVEFFSTRFKSDTRSIMLFYEDVDTFQRYVNWLYTGQLRGDGSAPLKHALVLLAKLYTLGELISDRCLQDAVMDAFVTITCYTHLYPTSDVVEIIYNGTMNASPARKLLVDIYVVYGNPKWIGQDLDKPILHQFSGDLMRASLEGNSGIAEYDANKERREALRLVCSKAYHWEANIKIVKGT